VVLVPALTSVPTWPAIVRMVPAEGAVIVVPVTSCCALFTAACAWVTASWSCAMVPGSTALFRAWVSLAVCRLSSALVSEF
jgi:hypothetical protein